MVIRDLDKTNTTLSEMHVEAEWLRSSLEATKVELGAAHHERIVA